MDKLTAIEALAALANETRLDVFRLLVRQGPGGLPAGEVADRLEVRQNTMSSHLSILSRAGLITRKREGRQILYATDYDGMQQLLLFLMEDCCSADQAICEPVLQAVQC
ncbi:MAG: metalloregulator ArsR/SmtB family transcription factor [Xanthomonadales bacterium]|nr:metalloregulator ArsR/SmtB family transcription factor [Xanthomonadales bacterium]